MNQRIHELVKAAGGISHDDDGQELTPMLVGSGLEKFAELLVEELRNVVVEVYHKTPLELCGPLLTADEQIAKHFGAH
jgi:hypothetical protein